MAHPYRPPQEGLRCLQTQSQARGGDTRRRAITRGELNRAIEAQHPISRTGIYCFVRGGTGGALPEPYKMTSSGLLVCMMSSQPSTVQLDWHLPDNTGIGMFTIGGPFSSQLRAGSQLAHVTYMKEYRDVVAIVLLPATSSIITGLAVCHWWSGEAYPWRVAPPCASQQYPDCC